MDPITGVYCPLEDIVCLDENDVENFDGSCPNCGLPGAVLVAITEKE